MTDPASSNANSEEPPIDLMADYYLFADPTPRGGKGPPEWVEALGRANSGDTVRISPHRWVVPADELINYTAMGPKLYKVKLDRSAYLEQLEASNEHYGFEPADERAFCDKAPVWRVRAPRMNLVGLVDWDERSEARFALELLIQVLPAAVMSRIHAAYADTFRLMLGGRPNFANFEYSLAAMPTTIFRDIMEAVAKYAAGELDLQQLEAPRALVLDLLTMLCAHDDPTVLTVTPEATRLPSMAWNLGEQLVSGPRAALLVAYWALCPEFSGPGGENNLTQMLTATRWCCQRMGGRSETLLLSHLSLRLGAQIEATDVLHLSAAARGMT